MINHTTPYYTTLPNTTQYYTYQPIYIYKAMKKLYRSSNRILAGVCGGIAEYFDVDPTLIRVVYAVLSIFTVGFPGLLLYIILMILMPNYNQIDNQ